MTSNTLLKKFEKASVFHSACTYLKGKARQKMLPLKQNTHGDACETSQIQLPMEKKHFAIGKARQTLGLYSRDLLFGDGENHTGHIGNRRKLSRLISILIVFALLPQMLSVFVLAAESESTDVRSNPHPFADVSTTSWYYEAVNFTVSRNLFYGVSDDSFAPDMPMSRAMLVTVLWREAGAPSYMGEMYADVLPESWYAQAVGWASENGIVYGVGNNLFSPEDSVTREEIATILYRYSTQKETYAMTNMVLFSDTEAISEWANEAMFWATANNYIIGIEANGKQLLSPQAPASRAQVATILMRYIQDRALPQMTIIQYGTSGSGKYPLNAYKLGSGENTLLLTFSLHGWEDNFAQDGAELVYLGNYIIRTLRMNYSIVEAKNWTVYVIPCANPDGLYLGDTCNGPGRCTTTCFNDNGAFLTDRHMGVDINRCFPYNFVSVFSLRNYTGSTPLQCVEARSLASFVQNIKGTGCNICIDTHGWCNQIIPSEPKSYISNVFHAEFPKATYGNLKNGKGYFSAWAAYSVGYDSCLFELPRNIYSHSDFVNSGAIQHFENAIMAILQHDS